MTGGSARSVGVRASGDAGVTLACGAAGQWAWRGAKLACGGKGRARRLGRVGAASGGVGPGEREGKAVGKSGPRERADRAGVRESWAVRAGLLAVGVWAGFQAGLGFLFWVFSSFLFLFPSLLTQTNLNSNKFEFKTLFTQTNK